MPRRTHHADSVDKRANVFVANGTPLSERIRFGSPYSWNSCVKIGLAPSPAVARSEERRVGKECGARRGSYEEQIGRETPHGLRVGYHDIELHGAYCIQIAMGDAQHRPCTRK